MSRSVPRILPLSPDVAAPSGTRFALLHVVSGERHHLGWFQRSDDPWRVGLTDALAVAEAGVPPEEVERLTEEVLDRLRAARDAGDTDLPDPVGPIVNGLRLTVDRRRAIERLEDELRALAAEA